MGKKKVFLSNDTGINGHFMGNNIYSNLTQYTKVKDALQT